MSALSNWVTCGMAFQACDRCSAVLRRMPDIGLRSTAPHFEKSGSATEPPESVATLAWPPPPRLDMTCLVKVLTSSWLIRPPGPVPRTWRFDAEFARQAAYRRRGRGQRAAVGGRSGRTAGRKRQHLVLAIGRLVGRRCRRCRLAAVGRAVALPWSGLEAAIGRAVAFARALAPGRRRRRRFGRGRWRCDVRLRRGRGGSRGAVARLLHHQHRLARLYFVAGFDPHFRDPAGHRRRHFQRRLVGLEFQHRLIGGEHVAGLHHHAEHVARGYAIAQVGENEFFHVATSRPRGTRRYETAGSAFSVSMPRSLIACATTLASICFSCISA